MRRIVYDDGFYENVEQGISLGCPLSPLMGALFLDLLDRRMKATGLFYVRFMDDWVILSPTRWKLRKAVRIVNETLAELRVEQHPDKTFVGRISRSFSFLGYRFRSLGLVDLAQQTVERFVERMTRLYEQGADPVRIGEYIQRWWTWACGGLDPWDDGVWSQMGKVVSELMAIVRFLRFQQKVQWSVPNSGKTTSPYDYGSWLGRGASAISGSQ